MKGHIDLFNIKLQAGSDSGEESIAPAEPAGGQEARSAARDNSNSKSKFL